MDLESIIKEIAMTVNSDIEHKDTIKQIEQIFKKNGFYTTREYPIFEMKNTPERRGRIDLVARKGKFRVAVEYDHHKLIKWKSFEKIVQIKPDVAIAITGLGYLKPSTERGIDYVSSIPLYIISLRQKRYKLIHVI